MKDAVKRRGRPSLSIDCAAAIAASKANTKSLLLGSLQDYEVLEVIGRGGSAVVYRSVRRSSGEEVALKIVHTEEEEIAAYQEEEYALLKRISHPGIVRALDLIRTQSSIVLVLSLIDGITLDVAVRRESEKRFTEHVSLRLFVQILQALDHLHQRRIVHRDIKPENSMVTKDLTSLKLIDFNIARYLPEGGFLSPSCTKGYAAPEVLLGGSPSELSDIWGAGLCLHMMLSGHVPYASVCSDAIKLKGSDLPMVSGPCRSTVQQCLALDDKMRPAAMSLLQSDWVCHGLAVNNHELLTPYVAQKHSTSCSSGSLKSSVSSLGDPLSGCERQRRCSSPCSSSTEATFRGQAFGDQFSEGDRYESENSLWGASS